MPALVIIYTILGATALCGKSTKTRTHATVALFAVSFTLLMLSWIGPNPGLIQE